jgi:hypothetical protein
MVDAPAAETADDDDALGTEPKRGADGQLRVRLVLVRSGAFERDAGGGERGQFL